MKTIPPRLSIVTVVKNSGQALKETVENVSRLAYPNIEYIVVDGGDTAASDPVLDRYRDVVTVRIQEPDMGIYDAMNKGWQAASAEGNILYLGAGDKVLSLPRKMEKLSHGHVLFGDVWIGKERFFRSRVSRQLKFANTLHHQALIIPKRIHPAPPFNQTYRVYADFDFNQRLLKDGVNFFHDDSFVSYAAPGGESAIYSKESYKISMNNFGLFWGALSYAFFRYSRARELFSERPF